MSEIKTFTAQEALKLSYSDDPYRRKRELESVFQRIRECASKGETNCSFYGGCTYNLELICLELPKYGYSVKKYTNPLQVIVNWIVPKTVITPNSGHKVDPDKSYILPMERTTRFLGFHMYAELIENQWATAYAKDNEHAISYGLTVKGSDILNAPEWVKAIKPVEVKE